LVNLLHLWKPFLIILYSYEQMTDFQKSIGTSKKKRVGIDGTFNLGNFYVTSFVYKNERVIRKDSSDHPAFLGPVFLYKEATFHNYHYFLSNIKSIKWIRSLVLMPILFSGSQYYCLLSVWYILTVLNSEILRRWLLWVPSCHRCLPLFVLCHFFCLQKWTCHKERL
jgi:hypothetical protein